MRVRSLNGERNWLDYGESRALVDEKDETKESFQNGPLEPSSRALQVLFSILLWASIESVAQTTGLQVVVELFDERYEGVTKA